MKARLINYWDSFRGSFWFRPVIMSVSALLFAFGLNSVDSIASGQISRYAPWLETTPSAARSALSSIAGAMIPLAGVIFSITVVTVSMASSQYGSRLLRCFMQDSIADFVMGAFVGTALFSLVTLRSVRDVADVPDPFTPHISTAVSMLLGLMCVALLIYFIHDVAVSIQAPKVVQALSQELNDPLTAMNCIDRLSAALARMTLREIPCHDIRDDDGRLLVSGPLITCDQVIHDAFRQIRQYGASRADVAIRIIEALHAIAENATRKADLIAVSEEAHAVRAQFFNASPQLIDARDFQRRFATLLEKLGSHADAGEWGVSNAGSMPEKMSAS